MCGIAGIAMASGAWPDAAKLNTMLAALAHRGPDGGGEAIEGSVALGHTRLAIIDLATGDQPFFAHDAALIANGEIYNYPALRAALPGTNFVSHSDCEPPLHLWAADHGGFTGQLRGMYAIAIHDRAAQTLTLARDPFGIKPLYTASFDGGLAFASEPHALLAAGFGTRAVAPKARAALLNMQFCTGRQTIFPGIERLLPGETALVENGRITTRAHRPALPSGAAEQIDEAAALKRLDAALMDSVEHHQRSDVPYGMFLSGGIDSASVLACMARLSAHPLAFTAGFDVRGAADERALAAGLAASVGARHEAITITRAQTFRHLPEIVACMDDPAADYAIIPTWFLARRARQDVKVVLSGEGGDEIFAGYGRYRKALRPRLLGGRAMRARGAFAGLGVLRDEAGWRDGWGEAEAAAAAAYPDRLRAAQAADIAAWLPHDLLIKLDRCLMAHGVEGRTPLLDQAITAAGFSLPEALKLHRGLGKYLLRQWLAQALPAARPMAPKQGFTVPVGAWIDAEGAALGTLVAAQPGVAEIAPPDRVRALFAAGNQAAASWALLFYALWHSVHILGVPADGDTAAVLASAARAG